MARLAWFTPLPPIRSGIASYCAELLPTLAPQHRIDVFVDADRPDRSGQLSWAAAAGWDVPRANAPPTPRSTDLSRRLSVWPAWDFLPRHRRSAYDLIVYQLGNAACHDYLWPYLVAFPGLVVLHDGRIHHARARALVEGHRFDDYRAEFRFNHPNADPVFAEYAINGFGASLYYFWPMRRIAIAAARAVAVHSHGLAAELVYETPGAPVLLIRQGLRAPIPPPVPVWHAPGPGPVFAAYGGVTPEKQVPSILRAFAAGFGPSRRGHLLLVGETAAHYDAEADAAALGIANRVTLAGYVPDEALDAWIQAAEVALCLRWPTARETSGPWIRALGAGKATIISAVAQYAHVPAIDARTGTLLAPDPRPDGWGVASPGDAVSLSVDLVDPEPALALAMRRLANDEPLRRSLGDNARRWWEREHAPALMRQDYHRVIEHALGLPARPASRQAITSLPHLRDDGSGLAQRIADAFGVSLDVLRSPLAP